MGKTAEHILTFPPLEQDKNDINDQVNFQSVVNILEMVYATSFPTLFPNTRWAFVRGSTLRLADDKLAVASPYQDIDFEASAAEHETLPNGRFGMRKAYLFAPHTLTTQEVEPRWVGHRIEAHLYLYGHRQFEEMLRIGNIFPASRLIDICQPIVGEERQFADMVRRAYEIYFSINQSINPLEQPFTVSEALRRVLDTQLKVEPHRIFGLKTMVGQERTWPRNLKLLSQRVQEMLDYLVEQGKLTKQEIDGYLTYQATNLLAVLPVNIWGLRRDFLISDLYFLLPSLTDARANHLQKVFKKILWASIYAVQNKNNCRFVFNSINS